MQHQKQSRKKGTDTTVAKYEIAKTFVDDPSLNAIASSRVLVRLTGSRPSCFEIAEDVQALPLKPTIERCVPPVSLYSKELVKSLPGDDDDDDGVGAESGEHSASGDFGPRLRRERPGFRSRGPRDARGDRGRPLPDARLLVRIYKTPRGLRSLTGG